MSRMSFGWFGNEDYSEKKIRLNQKMKGRFWISIIAWLFFTFKLVSKEEYRYYKNPKEELVEFN